HPPRVHAEVIVEEGDVEPGPRLASILLADHEIPGGPRLAVLGVRSVVLHPDQGGRDEAPLVQLQAPAERPAVDANLRRRPLILLGLLAAIRAEEPPVDDLAGELGGPALAVRDRVRVQGGREVWL